MKISSDNKYLLDWKYYEVARYVPSLDRVIREKNKILDCSELNDYAVKNGNVGIYSSVFAYSSVDIEKSTRLRTIIF